MLKRVVYEYMCKEALVSISKVDAVKISSIIWQEGMVQKRENCIKGFEASGIFPVSLTKMYSRLKKFQDGGVKHDIVSPNWLKVKQTIRADILTIPAEIGQRKRRRVTFNTNRRLFSREMLEEMDI